MKSTELSRAQLIRMIGKLRGALYSMKYDKQDYNVLFSRIGIKKLEDDFLDDKELNQIVDETTFDVDEDIGEK